MTAGKLYFEDVEVGDDIGPVERVVTHDQASEFVRIWGPERGRNRFNDAEVARQEGLPGPIVPGALSMAMMSQLLTDWAPTVTLKTLDVVFRQMVLHNVPLYVKGIVTDKGIVDGEPRLDCDVFMENEEGSRLIIGKATVVVATRGS